MYMRLQIGLWTAAAVFGLATIDTADAAKVQAKANTNFSNVIAELHHAKHLLDHVNHTYNGHRAKADHEISQAIHVLHHEHHKKGAHKTEHKHQGTHESKQESDTELRMAEKLVHAALHELSKHQDHKAHEASKFLHKAAREIEEALHVHHKHHAKK
jgi:hypothetical protein